MRASHASRSSPWRRILTGALLWAGASAQSGDAPVEVPTSDNYLRRMGGRSVVIGNYIYHDGGSQSERGFSVSAKLTNPVNVTVSLDLSTSWSPADVEFNQITRPDDLPVMNRQHIMKDASEDTFYVWGGSTASGTGGPPDPPVLWKFKADGRGGGEWLEETDIKNQDRFETLDRTSGGAYASTPDKGFIFGGDSGRASSPNPVDNVSGYVSYDFDEKEWTRDARGPYTRSGGLFGATATYVPNFGPNGVIVILGGTSKDRATDYLDFTLIHFMDPVTGRWFTQVASGDAPDERATHCTVGVSGNNNTYELFVYGGEIRHSFRSKRDMYALSLPGFHWTKLPDNDSTERRDHVCDLVGERQMLSWGGLNSSRGGNEGHWQPQDPLPMGIGIFDLTEWEWKDSYDADAEPYETHDSIQSWYDNGGLSSVSWSSDEVEELFASQSSDPPSNDDEDNSDSDNSNDNGGGNSDNNDSNNNNDDGGSSISGGTIAGAVIGGVAGIALGAALTWFCLRRRKRANPDAATATPAPAAELPPTEPSHTPKPYPYAGSPAYTESYAHSSPHSQPSPYPAGAYGQVPSQQPQQTSELMGHAPPVEMADTSRMRY